MTAATLLGTWPAGSDEWLAARTHGIGGSEVAPILGLSPFESRFSLWHRKAGNVGPIEETPEMEWGKRLEPATLQKFRDNHPEWSFDDGPGSTWSHPDRPWQIANPDMVGDELVEAKHPLYADGWGPDGSEDPDAVPIYYRVQGLWYCDTLGRDRIRFAVLIGACDYREYVVHYDPAEAAELRAAARDFLDTLERNEAPSIDGHDATFQTIRELHPDIDPVEVELDASLVADFVKAKANRDAAKQQWQQAAGRVADAMGTARKALFDGKSIATRQARNGGTPYLVAGRNLPDPSDLTPFTPKETP